jgi:eukaryotic-like serine/threonine-protein kinase
MVGELAMGRFRILERVGSGGMGTVYRAFDERLERHVAVKEIFGADARRVLREAQAAARLNHPGIVTLYELGAEGGRAILVSELVEGTTLAQLARTGELSDREVAELGADICGALGHAHGRGVVHRDLKPHNVIVGANDGAGRRAKLMDFGIASLAGAPTVTATGEVVGTLAYMAPEQAAGEPVDGAADVYSLALTLYECWAGTNPVARPNPAQTALEIGEPVPSLAVYRPDLPSRLVDCVDACLDPHPAMRPNVEELRRDLETSSKGLDGVRPVPAPRDDDEPASDSPTGLRVAQLTALCAWGLVVAVVAAGAGRPGLALVLGTLSAPAIIFASRLGWAAVPLLAPLLGAVSLAPAYPAIAAARGRALERAVIGALGWWCLWAAAAVTGSSLHVGVVDPAPTGWSRSTAEATRSVLAPLLAPEALIGAATFAVAAVALGLVLRAGHVAVALLGALLWAAGLGAALRLVDAAQLGDRPILIAVAALAAVIVEFRRRPQGLARRPVRAARVAAAIPSGEPAALP